MRRKILDRLRVASQPENTAQESDAVWSNLIALCLGLGIVLIFFRWLVPV